MTLTFKIDVDVSCDSCGHECLVTAPLNLEHGHVEVNWLAFSCELPAGWSIEKSGEAHRVVRCSDCAPSA